MKIKNSPEEFIVKEINTKISKEPKEYFVYLLIKRNIGTIEALKIIEDKFKTKLNFSGMKDKVAITTQFVSCRKKIDDLTIHNSYSIILKHVGYRDEPLSLGSHEGNYFEIKAPTNKEPFYLKEYGFPNYFGEQRFSFHNVAIGKAILRKDFDIATKLLQKDPKYGIKIKEVLESKPNNYIAAIRTIPEKLLRLYVASVQSYFFNKKLSERLRGNKITVGNQELHFEESYDETEIELPGWDKEFSEEGIASDDFLVRQIPNISLEGETRKAFSKATDISYDGEWIKFKLPKGSYATIFLRTIFEEEVN